MLLLERGLRYLGFDDFVVAVLYFFSGLAVHSVRLPQNELDYGHYEDNQHGQNEVVYKIRCLVTDQRLFPRLFKLVHEGEADVGANHDLEGSLVHELDGQVGVHLVVEQEGKVVTFADWSTAGLSSAANFAATCRAAAQNHQESHDDLNDDEAEEKYDRAHVFDHVQTLIPQLLKLLIVGFCLRNSEVEVLGWLKNVESCDAHQLIKEDLCICRDRHIVQGQVRCNLDSVYHTQARLEGVGEEELTQYCRNTSYCHSKEHLLTNLFRINL